MREFRPLQQKSPPLFNFVFDRKNTFAQHICIIFRMQKALQLQLRKAFFVALIQH